MQLWEAEGSSYSIRRMPLFYPNLKPRCLLFVGINPSFNDKGFSSISKGSQFTSDDMQPFFAFPNSGLFDIALSLEIDKLAMERLPYFKKSEIFPRLST
jgi:hypothetical protein